MINTQKLTALAFSLHDGLYKKEDDLTPDQKNQAVRCRKRHTSSYSSVFKVTVLLHVTNTMC